MPKISELPAGTSPVGTEYFPAVQGVVTSRFTLNQVYAATKTLTNTTYDTAGTGNSFSINGAAATANTGTGAVARAAGPTFTTPTLGAALATSLNGNTFTTGTYTLTGAAGKTFTFSNTLTFAGTDGTTMTLPTTSATLARTDAANTFTGTQTIGALVATSFNGNTLTTGTYVLTGTAGKTFTFSNTLTLAGTDASTLNVGVGGTLTGSSSAAIWYDNIPQNSKSAAYTTVLADAQKHIYHPGADTTARIWTIDSNANVAYPIGTAITFINDTSAGVITISITTDTMVLAGPGTTGSRTLAASGMATAVKMTATRWMISGTGLT